MGLLIDPRTDLPLPQPDQLCGPFSAVRALVGVTEHPPTVTALAVASGTRVWPHDVPQWRPAGAPLLRDGWDSLPRAAAPADSGTNATGLAAGIAALCPDVAVVPASGSDWSGLERLLATLGDVGILANVRTGPIAPPGTTWDVGHFVVLAARERDRVLVADTYAELGAAGEPPGCRWVAVTDLARALPDRGLLLLVPLAEAAVAGGLVHAAGLTTRLWAT